MRFFICLLAPDGSRVPEAVQRVYEALPRSRGLAFRWQSVGQVQVLVGGDDEPCESLLATAGDLVAVGMVRLDNRAELQHGVPCPQRPPSDLELVLHAIARYGAACVDRILGDF